MLDIPDARDSAHPCRPTVSCTADLTSPGTLEVEAGELAAVASGGAHVASFPVLLKQTFTPLLQLQVGSNGYTSLGPVPRARGGSMMGEWRTFSSPDWSSAIPITTCGTARTTAT